MSPAKRKNLYDAAILSRLFKANNCGTAPGLLPTLLTQHLLEESWLLVQLNIFRVHEHFTRLLLGRVGCSGIKV